VFYTVSTFLFGSYRVLYDSSILWCYFGLTYRGLGIGFTYLSERFDVPFVRFEVDLPLSFIFPIPLVAVLSIIYHQEPIRRCQLSQKSLKLGYPSVNRLLPLRIAPAETDPVPPEQLPLLGSLPDPASMQSLVSQLVFFEARIRELESMFAGRSSYVEALESCVLSLDPLLPQAQRAELQVVEALAGG
jgi:hypothetical protein